MNSSEDERKFIVCTIQGSKTYRMLKKRIYMMLQKYT